MLKKLFGKKDKVSEEVLVAPLNGKVLDLEEVPDPVFSQKMMGEGLAIEPADGNVVAPIAGEIVQLFPTKHAIGIKTEGGLEVLIHIGLETVSMEGDGFEGHVEVGDKVKPGDSLITFDMDKVKEKAKSTITPVIITNSDEVENMERLNSGEATKGETELLKVTVK
ncbi:PTS glucose transporter subunit IIA [Pontibacillus chungwhensis BH030062]|uniref:PTS glucose transporter subunit IIA n=2 Tax=Pontibacillus TaxID=289201 RepID=A0A0A2URW2_9BACI|nr:MULTISPECIES: PTS glucose transporter subunit IIA [Pontibacillus]KGP91032.1 PTS glucose transporter subunit IIA [Pontibacillus chungwhensis BH030062]GGD26257.1 PTS system glucose-specific EIIA component [Pontibacillus salipaludis]